MLFCFLFFNCQMGGPIKEKDGRVRHVKGVGEKVAEEKELGKSR